MRKVVQINASANWGSTGKIAEQIGECAISRGWESYIAYGRHLNPTMSKRIKIGNFFGVLGHYAVSRFMDREGLGSYFATKRLISRLEDIKPDIIHLHNIHDHYLNYRLLFKYLSTTEIPVVWTHHDLWAMTGGCAFDLCSCGLWQIKCQNCPGRKSCLIDNSTKNWEDKRTFFTSLDQLSIVTVSDWLGCQVRNSFFYNYQVLTIHNGVDLNVFIPLSVNLKERLKIRDKYMLLGVAFPWNDRKGLRDYILLSKLLPENYVIILVGLSREQIATLPANIIGINRTQNQNELAQLYSSADVLLSLSYGETFGMTMAESLACGTPVIVYDNTAQPEIVTDATGYVVQTGNIQEVVEKVLVITKKSKVYYSGACRTRAEQLYDNNKCFNEYVSLYETLISNKDK